MPPEGIFWSVADYVINRGVVQDNIFELLDAPGGDQIDQYNWTDGLVGGQWPQVKFYTGAGGTGTDVSTLIAKNITSDIITSATHKHPTGTTGTWRKGQGDYRERTQASNSLVLGTYYMRVTFMPSSTGTRTEDFTVDLRAGGDISPGTEITPDDVRVGFSTSLTDDEIQPYIDRAIEDVLGALEAGGISDPEALFASLGGTPRQIRIAMILRAQCLISSYDLSSGGRVRSVQEGSERVTFATTSKEGMTIDPCSEWRSLLDLWLRQNAPGRQLFIGTVTRRVGMTVNAPEGASSDPDAEVF